LRAKKKLISRLKMPTSRLWGADSLRAMWLPWRLSSAGTSKRTLRFEQGTSWFQFSCRNSLFVMNPSSILIWNARSLNQNSRCNVVSDVIRSSNAPVVCLQENKIAIMNQRIFLSVFGTAYDKYVELLLGS